MRDYVIIPQFVQSDIIFHFLRNVNKSSKFPEAQQPISMIFNNICLPKVADDHMILSINILVIKSICLYSKLFSIQHVILHKNSALLKQVVVLV